MLDLTACMLIVVFVVLVSTGAGMSGIPAHTNYGEDRKPDLSPFSNPPYELREHPRIHLNERRLARLRADRETIDALKKVAAEDDDPPGGGRGSDAIAGRLVSGALAYAVTREPVLAQQAGKRIERLVKGGLQERSYHLGARGLAISNVRWNEAVALGLDWCFDGLTIEQRKLAADHLKTALRKIVVPWQTREVSPFGNFDIRGWSGLMAAALAVGDFDDEGRELMLAAQKHWEATHGSALGILPGGGWPEGEIYAAIITPPHVLTADAISTATKNVDCFKTTPWYRNRLSYYMHASGPTIEDGSWRCSSQGDAERNRGEFFAYEHVTQTVLMDALAGTPEAAEARYRFNELAAAGGFPISDRMNAGGSLLIKALFNDPNQPAQPPVARAYYAPGTETTCIRGDWTRDAAWLLFQCGPRFTYHQHQDQGMFCIFKKGDLAIDSGVYDGGGLASLNNNMGAYYTRSIAHNVILFYNPAEIFNSYRSGMTVRNDGGERTWLPVSNTASPRSFVENFFTYDTGHVIAFEETPGYAYVAGDVTKAYNSTHYATPGNIPKLREWTRQIVFVRKSGEGTNDLIIIFDRTETTLPDFEKKWLLHCLNEPEVDGKATEVSEGEFVHDGSNAVITAGEGKLFCRTLLPAAHRIRKLGTAAKDQWVFGLRVRPDSNQFEEEGYGDWRIEVEPVAAARRDLFLHVLVPADKSQQKSPESVLTGESSVEIADGPRKVKVAFSASGTPAGQIEIQQEGRRPIARTLRATSHWEPAPPAPAGLAIPKPDPSATDPNRSTFLFKPHVNGYEGCRTATISREYPRTAIRANEQTWPNMEVGSGDKGACGFLRFARLEFPAGKTPTRAVLSLSVLWAGDPGVRTFTVHRLLAPLSFGELTWTYRNAPIESRIVNGTAHSLS